MDWVVALFLLTAVGAILVVIDAVVTKGAAWLREF